MQWKQTQQMQKQNQQVCDAAAGGVATSSWTMRKTSRRSRMVLVVAIAGAHVVWGGV